MKRWLLCIPLFCFAASVKTAVDTILQLPEGRVLYEHVQPVSIVANNRSASGFGALWDGGRRMITINNPESRSLGSLIRSILMELHNASTNEEFRRLARQASRRQISRWQYVEGVERMEHRNALKTIDLLDKGRACGLFPQDARWYMPASFNRLLPDAESVGSLPLDCEHLLNCPLRTSD
jgi:hypothetical protein